MATSDPPPFFTALSDVARKDLEAVGRPRQYRRGTTLFHEQDDGSQVNVLLAGQVKVTVSAASGREVIVQVFDPGELLGEISAIDGGPRSATVAALTDVEVLAIPQDEFQAFLERHSDAATSLLHVIAAKLRGATRRQLEFGTGDALGRLCRSLVELGRRYAEPGETELSFTLPLTQQELASFAGLSREAVVKGLAALRALGWIRTEGRTMVLLDEPALVARTEES